MTRPTHDDSPLFSDPNLGALLQIVLDLIVPPSADGRLPGASAVGVPAYLRAEAADYLGDLGEELRSLEAQARKRSACGFAALPPQARAALVSDLRVRNSGLFSRLAAEALACYYQNDAVIQALGWEARPPYPKGYSVPAWDESLLEPVRARGKIYRDPG